MRIKLRISSLAFAAVLSCFSLLNATTARAEEKFEDLLKRAQEFKDQGKFTQAMSELSWATKQLEKLHMTQLQNVFPNSVGQLTGGQFESNSALGLINIERTYTGGGAQIKASLSGSAATEGSAQQGMGMLSGLAGMAAMMGQTPGSDTVRIKGNRGIVQDEGGNISLMVPLSSGMILQVEPQGGTKPTKEQLVALAEGFNYDALTTLTQAK